MEAFQMCKNGFLGINLENLTYKTSQLGIRKAMITKLRKLGLGKLGFAIWEVWDMGTCDLGSWDFGIWKVDNWKVGTWEFETWEVGTWELVTWEVKIDVACGVRATDFDNYLSIELLTLMRVLFFHFEIEIKRTCKLKIIFLKNW